MHRIRLAAQHDEAALRQFLLSLFDYRGNVFEHAAQVAAAHASEDVDHRHHVIMGIDRRSARAFEGGQVGKNLGVVFAGPVGAHGDRVERGKRMYIILWRPDVHEVLEVVLRVEPVVGLHLAAPGKGEEHRVGHVALGEVDLRRLRAVDGQVDLGLVGRLLHAHVYGARHAADLLHEPRRDGPAFVALRPTIWISKGAGSPKLIVWFTISAGRK